MFALAGVVGAGLAALFRALDRSGASPRELAGLLALALGAALVALLAFDLEGALATLLLDRDLDLLRRAPIAPRRMFAIKLADALPRTAGPLIVLALPAVLAWSTVRPLPAWAWLLVPPALACLWIVPLALGLAIAIELLRLAPAHRAREALGLLSTLTVTALWLANLIVLPRFVTETGDALAPLRAWSASKPLMLALSPASWAAAALDGAREGDLGSTLRAGGALVTMALAAAGLAAWRAGRHLDSVLAAVRTPAARGPTRGARARPGATSRRAGLVGVALARDIKLFARDWTVLADVITAALLWTLLPLAGAALHSMPPPRLVRAMLTTLAVGMGYEIAARAFPIERRGEAWMRLAPVAPGSWVLARFAGATLLALPLVTIAALSLGLSGGLTAGQWGTAALTAGSALGLSVAVGLWVGATFADPGWTNPRAMLTLNGRLIAAGLMILQAGLWMFAAAGPGPGAAGGSEGLSIWVPAGAALALAALPIRAVIRRIAGREYSC